MIVSLVLRALQAIFSIIVLGLAITLLRGQAIGSTPPQTGSASFTGAWGTLIALIGLIATFFEANPAVLIVGLDAVSSLLFLAGGVALAIAMRTLSCHEDQVGILEHSPILDGGCRTTQDGIQRCYFGGATGEREKAQYLAGACTRARAGNVFQFFAMMAFVAGAAVTFWAMRKSGRSGMGRKSAV